MYQHDPVAAFPQRDNIKPCLLDESLVELDEVSMRYSETRWRRRERVMAAFAVIVLVEIIMQSLLQRISPHIDDLLTSA